MRALLVAMILTLGLSAASVMADQPDVEADYGEIERLLEE